MESPLIILDLETTGLSAYKDRVTEIAAVKVHNGEIIDEFHTLVNPGFPIPKHITRITGITDSMVADAPQINQVLPSLKDFLGEDVIVAHNAGFDMKFLSYNFLMHEEHTLLNPTVCTYKMANRLLDIPRKRLGDCCDHFGVSNDNAHRAMSDVLATVKVLDGMMNILKENNVSTTKDMITFQNVTKVKALKMLRSKE
jgi:DNA polymerase III epsilon subunit family exonuclease